jgi:hypothetical protein
VLPLKKNCSSHIFLDVLTGFFWFFEPRLDSGGGFTSETGGCAFVTVTSEVKREAV